MYHILFSSVEQEVDIGINHFSFHVKAGQPFGGIHSINGGSVDILHFQTEGGVRYGYWLLPGNRYYCQYSSESELYEVYEDSDASRYHSKFEEFRQRQLLVRYPQIDENDTWNELTRYINWKTISKVFDLPLESHIGFMDSSMSTMEESKLLTKVDKNKDISKDKFLKYTAINFKSKEAIRPDHMMNDFYDRSYYLYEVILNSHGSVYNLFSELQVSYLNCVMFGNYGSSMQWHSIVELLLTSDRFTQYKELDELLIAEFRNFPDEYIEMLINTECWTRILPRHHDNLPMVTSHFKNHPLLPLHKDIDNEESDIDPYQSDHSIEMNATSEDEDQPALVSGIYHGQMK